MARRITAEIVDVDGRFRALFTRAPKEMRQSLAHAVRLSAFSLKQRMAHLAPRSDDAFAPHIQDQIDTKQRGMSAQVGILEPGPTGIEADIALFNEYAPNKQPFMRPAAEKEEQDFKRAASKAIASLERQLGGFAGGLR